jgi:hypothetical protein
MGRRMKQGLETRLTRLEATGPERQYRPGRRFILDGETMSDAETGRALSAAERHEIENNPLPEVRNIIHVIVCPPNRDELPC